MSRTHSQFPGAAGLLAMLAASSAALGAEDPLACTSVTIDNERLACYDRALRPAPLAMPVPVSASASPSADAPAAPAAKVIPSDEEQERIRRARLGSTMAERWELEADSSLGSFLPRAYKPLYVLPVVVTSRLNRLPSSPAPDHSVTEPIPLDDVEAKFQISLKTKVWDGVFGDYGNLWVGYTQSSRWQVYNKELSRPFRETNYEPELMLVFATDYTLLGWQGRMAGISLNHQSNGRGLPLSRSWNRIIGELGLERGDWSLSLRPWWRVKEKDAVDDNPDISDHLGRGELLLSYKWQHHVLTMQGRHTLRSGENSRGSLQFDWAFPLVGTLHGYVQAFHGYGESLLDYNFSQSRLGLGVSIVEW